MLEQDAITSETKLRDVLERETCSRCGGTGEYSWCQSHGSRCFKCGGKGTVLTKRGAAASAYFSAMCTTEAQYASEGERTWTQPMALPGIGVVGGWGTITEIAEDEDGLAVRVERKNGPETAHMQPTDSIRLSDKPFSTPLLKSTAAYQAELTKQGKPRKAGRFGGVA